LAYNISTDGVSSVDTQIVPSAGFGIACQSGNPANCGATIRNVGGTIYVAFASSTGAELAVATATPIPGAPTYNWSVVHTDATVFLRATPEMEVISGTLVIVFPTLGDPPFANAFYTVTMQNGIWAPANDTFLAASPFEISSNSKPAMAVLVQGSTPILYMCTQQNGGLSDHRLFVYNTTDGIHWNFVEEFAQLSIGGNASMVNFNGSLVLANQQNSPNHLFIFTSPDGVSWTDQEYSDLLGGGPAIALFNGGVSLAYKSASSTNLFNSFATH
jgi:hypothetical protein